MACDSVTPLARVRHVIMNPRERREVVEEELGTYFSLTWKGRAVFIRSAWFRHSENEELCLSHVAGQPCGIIIDPLDALEKIREYALAARDGGAVAIYGLTSRIRIGELRELYEDPDDQPLLTHLYMTHKPEEKTVGGPLTLLQS